jgi:hypothetical protein
MSEKEREEWKEFYEKSTNPVLEIEPWEKYKDGYLPKRKKITKIPWGEK